ncbi:11629_t:CDS:2 [Entrophospora sp. SA101]|nr:11629_t:CDS:2 [Entrophospora sp. SA101]
MEFLEVNFDWLEEKLKELKDDYLLFDFPGQVELFTHHNSVKNIIDKLQKLDYRLVTVHLVDAHYCTDPSKYISILLLSLKTMLQIELPHINVLSKIDLMESYGKLAFNLNFYTEVQDLSYLLQKLDKDPFTSKFKELNKALCGLIEDFSLVGFYTLCIEDKKSVSQLIQVIDRANGYIFNGLTSNNESIMMATIGNDPGNLHTVMEVQEPLRKDPENTPLQDKLNDLAERIAKLGGTAAIIMLLTLLIKYFATFHPSDGAATIIENLVTIIISTVTIVVVAIPEGLPLAVTLALAYATTRMLKDNNLVRVLSACETMGNATTICSDKTGTLTQNKMTVVTGIIGSSVEFQRQGYKKNESLLKDQKSKEKFKEFNGRNAFVGSKTETALLDFLLDLGLDDFNDLRSQANVVQLFPFSSERKAMGILITKEDKWRFHIKGASEVLLSKSESVVNIATGDVIDLNNININNNNGSGDISSGSSYNMRQLEQLIESFANDSLRTITVAYRDFEQWPPKD